MLNLAKIQTRCIANITQNDHGRSTALSVTTRYRRTGAGFWFRAIPGRRKKIWQNLYYMRTNENIPFKNNQARHLPTFGDKATGDQMSLTYDMMVNKYYRQQRWTVKNAYQGYDKYARIWYYPGRHDEDPSNFQEGYFSHMKAFDNKANHSYDNENAYYEYCVNRHNKTFLDGDNIDEFHLAGMIKAEKDRNKRIVPKDL